MLIDRSYFTKGSRHILNATLGTLPNPNAREVVEFIEAFISEYQEEFLTRLLGSSVGNRLNAYLVCLDEDENPAHNERLDAVCDRIREPFADYVFYKMLGTTGTDATMNGLVRIKSANTPVSPLRRQVQAWNAMVEKNRSFSAWVSSECDVSGIEVSEAMLTKINSLNL